MPALDTSVLSKVLDSRYASGDISREQYDAAREDLAILTRRNGR